jgi:hypothetical protein
MILHVVLTVALGIGSQAIIITTTIIPPTHLHLTTQNLNSRGTTHQHGRIGGPDFGLELLLVV